MRTLILRLLPLVSGFDPAQLARDGYRRTFAQREAKKRGGAGGRHAKAAGTAQRRAEHVSFDELREANHTFDHHKAEARQDAAAVMGIAHRRWGAKGRRFVEQLATGATVEEASKAAGVSRQMGHRYMRFLRQVLANLSDR